jgi:two-component system, LytTR family, sensor kinase
VAALHIVGIFTAMALLFTGQVWLDYAYARVPVTWDRALLISAIEWYLWAALTPVVLLLARRLPLSRGTLLRALPVHLVASLLLTAFKIPVQEFLGGVIAGVTRQPTSFLKIYVSIFTYWVIVAAAMAARQRRIARERELRASKLEGDLARAQLDALRMRLNPHFLFNTLNGISGLMRENVEAADLMLTRLSDLLRVTLERADVQEVPLQQELDFVRQYVDIQQFRFGSRLTVTIDAASDTLTLAVPSLSLQPLVENAIRHGAERTPGPAAIAIVARRIGSALEIAVGDDGPGPGSDARPGTGLETTRLRLSHLYGDAGSLTLEPGQPRGAVARLRLPARVAS